jgi:glucosamine-6-phosphate deaminase
VVSEAWIKQLGSGAVSMATASGTPTSTFSDADALGEALAREIIDGLASRTGAQRYLLGCPGGRSLRSTYQALARILPADADLGRFVIVMMDEYLVETADGLRRIDQAAHCSCAGFAAREIVAPLDAAVPRGRGIDPDHVWLPDPSDPEAYDRRIEEAGGVDLFLVASGAGDGHVAFVPPPADPEGRSSIIRLAEQTRRDNLATFPQFGTLDAVPRWGVSVGLGTISRLSRRVAMVLVGAAKQESAARIVRASAFEPSWPATFIHGCPEPRILLDREAAGTVAGQTADRRIDAAVPVRPPVSSAPLEGPARLDAKG